MSRLQPVLVDPVLAHIGRQRGLETSRFSGNGVGLDDRSLDQAQEPAERQPPQVRCGACVDPSRLAGRQVGGRTHPGNLDRLPGIDGEGQHRRPRSRVPVPQAHRIGHQRPARPRRTVEQQPQLGRGTRVHLVGLAGMQIRPVRRQVQALRGSQPLQLEVGAQCVGHLGRRVCEFEHVFEYSTLR